MMKILFLFFKICFYRTGGTMGAIITCPLEVVKTRLQSSNSGFTPTPRTSISESSISSKKPSSASGIFEKKKIPDYYCFHGKL